MPTSHLQNLENHKQRDNQDQLKQMKSAKNKEQQKPHNQNYVIRNIIRAYRYLQKKVECPEIKKQFLNRKSEKTPKYRGQLHNYGKWISLIPTALLIYCAQTNTSRKYAIIYGIGVFWMQYISSLMHCRPYQSAPTWIRKTDNISIFVYIAMNYLVIGNQVLINDPNYNTVKTILIAIMTSAITLRSLTLHSNRWIISGLALTMGWLIMFGMPTIIQNLNLYEKMVLMLGGLSITGGTICWALQLPKKKKNSEWTPHETFHLGTIFMIGFFYLLLFSLQVTHPGE